MTIDQNHSSTTKCFLAKFSWFFI